MNFKKGVKENKSHIKLPLFYVHHHTYAHRITENLHTAHVVNGTLVRIELF